MDRSSFCTHCNLVVAPGDPKRVALGDRTAHKTCVMSHIGPQLVSMVYDFLNKHADQVVTNAYLDNIATSRSYDVFLRHTETALRRVHLVGKGSDKRRQRAVVDFAAELGQRLLKEVDYKPAVERFMAGIKTGT